jgi:hypothetical protein
MGAIKFPHTSGNSMSIAAPATNPASDLELKLPATIGTANQVLRNSGTAGTLEFGTLTTGKILQVVEATTETEVANNTVTMADSGLTASITPASGSKVLIFVSQSIWQYRNRNSTNNQGGGINILRDSTVIWDSKNDDNNIYSDWWFSGTSAQRHILRVPYNMLDDSPGGDGSTAIAYKTQFALTYPDDTGQMLAQPADNDKNGRSSIILMEVGS